MLSVAAKVRDFLKKVFVKEKGAALVVSLLVLMVLVLLGLTLILQSQQEYLGAVNENDSLEALSYAESGLEWAERAIKDQSAGQPDLDKVLQGPDDVVGGNDDGLIGIRAIDNTLTLSDLNNTCPGPTCEKDVSVKVPLVWDGTQQLFEAFRVGTDVNGDGIWDGPRAILYVRIEDNFDDPANSGIQDFDDNDFRARVRVEAQFPIFVDTAGVAQSPVLAARGVGTRRLEGRLSPAQAVAIRTNKEFEGDGTMKICGACGGVHSNGDMHFNGSSAQICANATATGDYSITGGGPNVQGDSGGGKPEEFIPTINPYDDKFVPSIATFNHAGDPELNFSEPGLGTALQCGPPTTTDPGASKYFALVFKKQGGQNLQVWKAYWGTAGSPAQDRWLWRLIDVGPTLNAVLDNCGRLVSSPDLGLGPDPCPAGNVGCDGSGVATYGVDDTPDCCGSPWPIPEGGDGITYCQPNCIDPVSGINRCRPDGIITGCDGNGDGAFYGFAGNNTYNTDSCGSDDSLSGVTENDFNRNDFYIGTITGGVVTPAGNNTDAGVPALPGTFEPDNVPDFIYSVVTQKNRQVWTNDTSVIFSPMYNAIVFIVGNMDFDGNMENGRLQFYDHNPTSPNPPATYSIPNPTGRWRVSPISYGRIQARGTPRFGPANSSTGNCAGGVPGNGCNVGMVAGRDLDLAGGAGSGCDVEPAPTGCNLCPNDPTAVCDDAPVIPHGYEGMFVAHEQVNLSGNANFAGFVIAEEAAYCVETNPPGLKTRMNGNPDIFYDCEHPPDPWLAELLRINSWEEIQ